MIKKLQCILITLSIFFIANSVYAEIRINEVYPAPASGEYEWIELYNDENFEINLANYAVKDLSNNPIVISGTIQPLHFYIATSSSILNNTGDTVYVLKNGVSIDSLQFGSATSDYSFARCPDGLDPFIKTTKITKNESNNILCIASENPTPTLSIQPTPLVTNTSTSPVSPTNTPPSVIIETITITPFIAPTKTSTPTPTITSIALNENIQNIYISEIYPYPYLGESEWVELYNNNDYSIALNNWKIDDKENSGSTPKIFSLSLEAKSYARIILSSFILNNNGDSVRLLNFSGAEIDSLEYGKCEQGYSFGRNDIQSDEICKQDPTPDKVNTVCLDLSLTSTPTPTQKKIPTNTRTPTLSNPPTSVKRNVTVLPQKPYVSPPKSFFTLTNNYQYVVNPRVRNINQSFHAEVLSVSDDHPPTKPPIKLFSLSGMLLSVLNTAYCLKKFLS